MSDSVRPHRQQPTRLPRPWDSPGKNTGVGCHFLLQRNKVKSEREVAQSCPTLCDPMDCSPPGSSICGIFQARVLEWNAISFSRGLFLTQGCNLCLTHWQVDSFPLSHEEALIAHINFLNYLCVVACDRLSLAPACGISESEALCWPLFLVTAGFPVSGSARPK